MMRRPVTQSLPHTLRMAWAFVYVCVHLCRNRYKKGQVTCTHVQAGIGLPPMHFPQDMCVCVRYLAV